MPNHLGLEAIDFQAEGHRVDFLEVKGFLSEARKVFTREELTGFLNYVSANPVCGEAVPGTTKLRRLTWGAGGQKSRNEARVVYYFRDLNMPLLLLAVYPKGQTLRISKNKMKRIEEQVEFLIEELTTKCENDTRVSGRSA